MSLLSILDIGKSALFASQTALNVTSNNIANVNTPGYSREAVVLSIANPVSTSGGMVGMGVMISGIQRSYDRFIQAQLLGQGQSQGRSSAMDNTWGQIESVFNESQGTGLSSALLDYFNAWQDVANDPTSQTPRTALLQKANTLTTNARSMERSILSTLNGASDGISDAVTRVNEIAADIAKLNGQISLQEAGSSAQSANELRDQRDQKLTALAQLVDFSTYEDNNGSLTVTVGMRNLVSGTRTNTLSAAATSDGSMNLVLDGISITGNVQKGEIGGLLAAQSDIQSTALVGLRKLVASITQQVNQLHQAGFGLDGSTANDFFAPLQLSTSTNSTGASVTASAITSQTALTLDEYTVTFDTVGGTYSVLNKQTGATVIPATAYNAAGTAITLPGISVTIAGPVTSTDTFTISPLANAVSNFSVAMTDPRKVAAASAPALPGDNTTALQIAQLTDAAQLNLGNTVFSDYYSNIVSTVGVMKRSASDGLTFDNNLMSALSAKRDSISGVSLDEEAANLVRYQRSYEASARMISVADQLMQTILRM